jgi:hypothetical protein
MPTYINAIPIAMNIIDNITNIPTPQFLLQYQKQIGYAATDEHN